LGISLSLAHLEGKVSRCLKERGSVRRYSVSSIRGNSFKDMDIVCYEGRYRRSFHPTAGNLCVSLLVFSSLGAATGFLIREERERAKRKRKRKWGRKASGQAFQSNLRGDVTSCKHVFGKAKEGVDEVNVKNQESCIKRT